MTVPTLRVCLDCGNPMPGRHATICARANLWGWCPCGHLWLSHDVEEYRGDGSETCCIEGCQQIGCPGRATTEREGAGDE